MAIDFIQDPSDLVNVVDELKKHHRKFILSAERWDNFTVKGTLNWKKVAFQKGPIPAAVPKKPGVYCFSINNAISWESDSEAHPSQLCARARVC
jgi:hypothetical protein